MQPKPLERDSGRVQLCGLEFLCPGTPANEADGVRYLRRHGWQIHSDEPDQATHDHSNPDRRQIINAFDYLNEKRRQRQRRQLNPTLSYVPSKTAVEPLS